MSNPNIVKGYKGIMDLDLSTIHPSFYKETIAQHLKDIQEYKQDQLSRPARLRYENTVEHAFKEQKKLLLLQKRINRELQNKQDEIYKTKMKLT